MTPYENIITQSPLQTFLEMICVLDHAPIDSEYCWKASVVLSDLIHRQDGFEELLKVNVEYIALLFPLIDGIKKHLPNRSEHFAKNVNELSRMANVFVEAIPDEDANTILRTGLTRLSSAPLHYFTKQADLITKYLPVEKHHQENHGFVLK